MTKYLTTLDLTTFKKLPNLLRPLALFFLIFMGLQTNTFAQSSINAGGADAVNGLSSTSFSIGQIDYFTNDNVFLGVQQPIYSFAPLAKSSQVIVGLSNIPVISVGGVYQIQNVVGGGSGNNIVFTSSDPNSLKVLSNTLIAFANGVYTVTATQVGNVNYLDASPVSTLVTVAGATAIKKSQEIVDLEAQIVLKLGDSLELKAAATSGLAITYLLDNQNVITIVGNRLKAIGVGNVNIIASQSGNSDYFAAPSLIVPVLVNPIDLPFSSVAGIIGKEIIGPGTETNYKQTLEGVGYTYKWVISPKQSDVLLSSDPNDPNASIRFNATTGSGLITSYVYDENGVLIQYSEIPFTIDNTINPETVALSNLLPELKCEPKPSDCNTSYINSFSVGKLENKESGCSSAGYGDFTASGRLDSLFMGENYDATISSGGNSDRAYFGIWIDYNKSGSFDDPGEFAISSLTSDSVFVIPNLLISNDPDFVGPRRLRVKMQTSAPFTESQSCQQVGGEGGETEDYMVYIRQADRLKAPNVITPNNDGKNDFFVIKGIDSRKTNKLVIVNRWGDILFEQSEYTNEWDGRDKNKNKLPRGTYYYFFSNGSDKIQGFVEVINE